jgi:hypothetical protein
MDKILQLVAAQADIILDASDASVTNDTTPNSSMIDTGSSSSGSGKSRFKFNYL